MKLNLEKDKEKFIAAYNISTKEAMQQFNISEPTVIRYAKKLGIARGSGGRTSRKLVFDDLTFDKVDIKLK